MWNTAANVDTRMTTRQLAFARYAVLEVGTLALLMLLDCWTTGGISWSVWVAFGVGFSLLARGRRLVGRGGVGREFDRR